MFLQYVKMCDCFLQRLSARDTLREILGQRRVTINFQHRAKKFSLLSAWRMSFWTRYQTLGITLTWKHILGGHNWYYLNANVFSYHVYVWLNSHLCLKRPKPPRLFKIFSVVKVENRTLQFIKINNNTQATFFTP